MSCKFWAKQAKNRNWEKVIIPMCLVFIFAFSSLFIIENEILNYLLPIIYILIGVGNGAYEIFDNVAIYEASKEKLQTSYVTFERSIDGIVTSLLPILSYTILSESDNIIKITFGIAIIAYLILGVYYGRKRIKE